jgi:CRP-like cAMP-binding protein
MLHSLHAHINKFVKIDNEKFEDILSYFQVQDLKKKENLLTEGQVCKASYFVINGILRKFFLKDNGSEQTTEFAIESWWMTETFSYINQSPSEFTIQAVENVKVLVLHRDAHDRMLASHPEMERYFRLVYQKAFAATQMRIKYIYEHSREDLYHFFKQSQPEFLQRVPQYLVASYLGFTPEYLSEIRRKSIS